MSAMDLLAQELADKIADEVMRRVAAKITNLLPDLTKVSYTEAEAAAVLNIAPASLAEKRKAGEIDFTQVIAPRRGDQHGGRIVYMRHHLLDFMLRNEVRHGKQMVSFQDAQGASNALKLVA